MRTKRLTVNKRRRRERKTDYKARLGMLKSDKVRLVVRKSNNYITAQLVESNEAQDKVIITANSKDLSKFGWNANKNNLPSAYLTGFLLGKKNKGKIKEAILDMGLYRNVKGSRIYACLKGVIDGEITIPHSKEMFPSEERTKGKHLQKETSNFEDIKTKIEQQFK